MNSASIGKLGEQEAIRYLKRQGYKIIETNFRIKSGEIDIIAKEGKIYCFIEVKKRRSLFIHPVYSIDASKRKRMIAVATSYLGNNCLKDVPCRFDILFIIGKRIELFKSAFDCRLY